ncbi:hypothetical protein DFAR_1550004 [Desulfarculales bacterium]
MWQTLTVVLVVGVAALWLARCTWCTFSGQAPACSCGDTSEDSSCGCPSLGQLAP